MLIDDWACRHCKYRRKSKRKVPAHFYPVRCAENGREYCAVKRCERMVPNGEGERR